MARILLGTTLLFCAASLLAIPLSHSYAPGDFVSRNPNDMPYDHWANVDPVWSSPSGRVGHSVRVDLGNDRRAFIGVRSGNLKLAYASSTAPSPNPRSLTKKWLLDWIVYSAWTAMAFTECFGSSGRSPEEIRLQHADVYSLDIRLWFVGCIFGAANLLFFSFGPGRRMYRRRRGLCTRCGYNLAGNSGVTCSECGTNARRGNI